MRRGEEGRGTGREEEKEKKEEEKKKRQQLWQAAWNSHEQLGGAREELLPKSTSHNKGTATMLSGRRSDYLCCLTVQVRR